jgi:hypothetical protein
MKTGAPFKIGLVNSRKIIAVYPENHRYINTNGGKCKIFFNNIEGHKHSRYCDFMS